MAFVSLCRRLVERPWFQQVVFVVEVAIRLVTVKGEERAGADERAGDPAARLTTLRAELEEIENVLWRGRAP